MSLQKRIEYWVFLQNGMFSGSWTIDNDLIIYWSGNLDQPSYVSLNVYTESELMYYELQRQIINGNLGPSVYPFHLTGPWVNSKDYIIGFQIINGIVFLDIPEFKVNGENGLDSIIETIEELVLLRPTGSDWYTTIRVINNDVPVLGTVRFDFLTGKISIYAGLNNETFSGIGMMGWNKTTVPFKK